MLQAKKGASGPWGTHAPTGKNKESGNPPWKTAGAAAPKAPDEPLVSPCGRPEATSINQERTVAAINNRNDIATALLYAGNQDKRSTPDGSNTMKTLAQPSFAERIGRALGRTWRAALRLDRKAQSVLVAQGMNANFATGILWVVRIALLGFVLYGAFWVVLVLGLAVLAVLAAQAPGNASVDNENDEEKAEWRMGLSGYGLYRGWTRVDPGDPDDDDG
jgi:hypothetical protein